MTLHIADQPPASLPRGLENAPFAVVWEALRVLLHCSVNPEDIELGYGDSWQVQDLFWQALEAHPRLQGKPFPEKSDPKAWRDSIRGDFKAGPTSVVFVARVEIEFRKGQPITKLILRPLKHERSSRLSRHFGSDRYLQLLIPSVHSLKVPSLQSGELERAVVEWLTHGQHSLAGRQWAPFWARAEKKNHKPKTSDPPSRESSQKAKYWERIHFFAEDGRGFAASSVPDSQTGLPVLRTRCTRDDMLDWLLQFRENTSQPCLKLFSRISLGNPPP